MIVVAPMGGSAQQELRALDAFGKLDSLKSLPQVKDITTLSSLLMSDRDGEIEGSNGKSAPIWNKSDLILRDLPKRIERDEIGSALVLAAVKLAAAMVMAAGL